MSGQSTPAPNSEQGQVEYRPISGWPGYRVGSDGTVWSCLRQVPLPSGRGSRSVTSERWRLLKQALCGTPPVRPSVGLHRDGKTKLCRVHTLVLLAFVGPCPPGMVCCHWDRNPSNNKLDNLRWDTPKANHADAVRHGTYTRGERQGKAKLTDVLAVQIRREYAGGGVSQQTLGERYGVDRSTIGTIVRRKTWKHV